MNNTETPYNCVINEKSTTKYDEGQCVIGNIAAILYKYDFGYFCLGPLGIITFLSIFGGIKQNYRWFILNQAIWDILKSFEFSCENNLVNFVRPSSGCFYYFGDQPKTRLNLFFHRIIMNNIYTPWVLISVTRFIALYYINFYDKLTKGYKIFYIFFIFYVLSVIFDTEDLISYWNNQRITWLTSECQIKESLNSTTCYLNTKDSIYYLFVAIFKIFAIVRVFKRLICLMISSIATMMIILKVAKQAKFQLKHNRQDFLNSTRVAFVITFQTAMNIGIICLEFLGNFTTFIGLFSDIPVKTVKYIPFNNNYIDFSLPLWIDGPLGLTGVGGQQIITQLRIFIESIIILCIMTGYRESLLKFFQKLYIFFQSPRKFYKSFKKASPSTSWT